VNEATGGCLGVIFNYILYFIIMAIIVGIISFIFD